MDLRLTKIGIQLTTGTHAVVTLGLAGCHQIGMWAPSPAHNCLRDSVCGTIGGVIVMGRSWRCPD
ncbi:MAG: hypothetical protein ACRD1G_00745 [Acidimicrobiales bacterium]